MLRLARHHQLRNWCCFSTGRIRRPTLAQVQDVPLDVRNWRCFSTGSIRRPTLAQVQDMPLDVSELSGDSLVLLAESGCQAACRERLTREVMRVECLVWDDADVKVEQISKDNAKQQALQSVPHKVGIATALVSAAASIPMCFHLPTVKWMNDYFVTSEVPEPHDLESFWEVGAWSWNWMEPVLGTASFVLLALQFSRSIMLNLDMKPFTEKMRSLRADKLAHLYPQYNKDILRDFSKAERYA